MSAPPEYQNREAPDRKSRAFGVHDLRLRNFDDPFLEYEEQVQELVSQMSLEEKAGQMRIVHANLGIELSDSDELIISDHAREQIKHGIAGIKNPGEHLSPERAALKNNLLQQYLIENCPHAIPALFITESYNGVDAHGTTNFSRPINMAASWNPQLVKRIWDIVGREARARGLHMCHSPEADIIRDPRFGRMSESFGEDTHLVTEMVVAAVEGVQGDFDGLKSTHIGAVTKHFAGYGQVEGGRNFASVQISKRDLIDQIFPPFQAAVQRARTLGIMASHGDLNGIASHANYWLLTEVLRHQWGFHGYTVSDANDIGRLFFFMGVAENEDEAALLGLRAGMNVDLYNEDCYVRLPELARKNPQLIPLIDKAVTNVLRVKFLLGLFDTPYLDVDQASSHTRTPTALDIALESDLESIILLKNERSLLPLEPKAGLNVALVGPVLNESALEQFTSVVGSQVRFIADKGFSLTNEDIGYPNLTPREECLSGMEKIERTAADADVVVLFLGGDQYTSKEAFFAHAIGDRAEIEPVGCQLELFERLRKLGKPIIVALKHRRTLAIEPIAEYADAILDLWDPSERGDAALAMTLFGQSNPSGRLPVTVPRCIGQIPFHYSQKEINFKKRYLFLKEGPRYPFGYGLSYTAFHYSNLTLSKKEVANGDSLEASITLSNTGDRRGKEVVQLYIQDLHGSVVRPAKELKAFRKVDLQPGQKKTLSFTIEPEMLAMTGLDMVRAVENGSFVVQIGPNSAEGLTETFTVILRA